MQKQQRGHDPFELRPDFTVSSLAKILAAFQAEETVKQRYVFMIE